MYLGGHGVYTMSKVRCSIHIHILTYVCMYLCISVYIEIYIYIYIQLHIRTVWYRVAKTHTMPYLSR